MELVKNQLHVGSFRLDIETSLFERNFDFEIGFDGIKKIFSC